VAGNSRLKTQVGDFRTLASGTQYDLLLACEVFEHIEDDESAFRAAAALLKTNGHFIFSVPAFMRNWGPADKYAGHFRRYERAELIAKFKRHGFEIKTIWCYGFPLTQMLYLPYKLYYGWKLARQPLSMEESTKRSGTERTLVNRMAKLPVAKLMWPLFKCQQWVKNTNIGDGYLILARKI
jgi:SAM-dependent methyltransferase